MKEKDLSESTLFTLTFLYKKPEDSRTCDFNYHQWVEAGSLSGSLLGSHPSPFIDENGVHACGVNSTFPSMTYLAHTSIVTGTRPAEHGIYYNGVFQCPKKSDSIYWRASWIKTHTLWEAAKSAGLRTASAMWPVSAGAPVDYNIPDAGSMGEIAYHNSNPQGFIEEVKKNVLSLEGRT